MVIDEPMRYVHILSFCASAQIVALESRINLDFYYNLLATDTRVKQKILIPTLLEKLKYYEYIQSL